MNKPRSDRARAIVLLAILAMLSACDWSPKYAGIVPAEQRVETLPPTSRNANNVRIRYPDRDQPVFIALDRTHHPITSMLAISRRMGFGDYVWDDQTTNGAIWIRVDLARQLMSVFRGEDEIGSTVIIYGTDGKNTPSGTFLIQGRESMHRSTAYDADMPFTLWLTNDGVAIHASSIERGRATHGCIGVPADFAEKLFKVARRGDRVFILPPST